MRVCVRARAHVHVCETEGGAILVQRDGPYLLVHSPCFLWFMSFYIRGMYFPLQTNHGEKDVMGNTA